MTLNITTTLSPKEFNEMALRLRSEGKLDDAIGLYRGYLAQYTLCAGAWGNLGACLLEVGEHEEAIANIRRAIELQPEISEARSALIMALMYSEKHTQADVEVAQQDFQLWTEMFITPRTSWPNKRDAGKRPRVGYLSYDLRAHSVGRFMQPILANHTDAVEIVVYSTGPRDEFTDRIGNGAGNGLWRDCQGVSDEALDAMIFADEIDVLVDLGLHTSGGRPLVMARKPAPVQISYLGYPGDSGLKAINHFITDAALGGNERSLKVGSYFCYQRQPECPGVAPEPHDGIVFGSLANFSKINEDVLTVWQRIMKEVPGARMLIHAPEGSARRKVLKWLPTDRVEFVGRQSYVEYLKTYNRIDVVLDTWPWSGGTTTCDALSMGVPVASLWGNKVCSRSGASILTMANLRGLIGPSVDFYIANACLTAHDMMKPGALRLPRLGYNPFDTDGREWGDIASHVRDLEGAYREAWKRFCS